MIQPPRRATDPAPTLLRPAWAGALVGVLCGAVWAAPASWMALLLQRWTDTRVQALHASGTLWNGQASLALGAGPGSGAALAMPGQLSWTLRPTLFSPGGPGLQMQVQHPVLLAQGALVRLQWSGNTWALQMRAKEDGQAVTAQLPAAWLAGLGAPWNTLQPSGRLQLRLERLRWEAVPDRTAQLDLALRIQLTEVASRISTLPVLGDYELLLEGGSTVNARLSTRPGSALQLEGHGQWTPGGPVAFQGQASALAGREEALANLLNIIGRRDGPRSLMAFGSPELPGPTPAATQ